MSFDRAGNEHGVPVLLLHGIPGWRGTWREAGTLLAQSHDVIVPDLPGFGDSGEPPPGSHAAGHADAIAGLLHLLGVKCVHVAGCDFGGPVAVSLWRSHPELIGSLTLLATNVFTDTPIPPPLRIAKVPVLGDAAFRVLMGKTGLSLMWFAAVRRKDRFPRDRYQRALQFPAGVRWTRQIFLNSLRHLDVLYRPIEGALASITVPTTVIWGDSDPFFPVTVGKRTAGVIPGARYVELADCGHFVPEEHPSLVASTIIESIRMATPWPIAVERAAHRGR